MSPVYNDPSVQKKFEQFCMTQYGKKVNVKTIECTHADEKGIDRTDGQHERCAPRQESALKQKMVGDGELLAAKETLMPSKHQDDGDTLTVANPTGPQELNICMQATAVEKTLVQQEPPFANPTGPRGLNSCLQTPSVVKSNVLQDPTFANLTRPCGKDSTVLSQAISKEDEIPKFSSPSKQRVLHTPVMQTPAVEKSIVQQDPACANPTGPRGLDTCMQTPVVEKSLIQQDPACANPTGPQGLDTCMQTPVVEKSLIQQDPACANPTGPRGLDTCMQTPVVEKSLIQQDPECANPTGPQGLDTCMQTPVVEKSLIQQDPACANPTGPWGLDTCLQTPAAEKSIVQQDPTFANLTRPCGEDSSVISQTISMVDEIPKFSSPSKQRVLHTPVMQTPAVEKSIVQQDPACANPTGPRGLDTCLQTPVVEKSIVQQDPTFANLTRPCGKDSTVLSQAISKEDEIPKFSSPSKQRVLQTPVVIKPTVIPCNSEVPVFLSPSQQPVTNSPVQSGTVLQPPMCDFDQLFANAPLPPGIDPRDLSPDTISLILELMNFKPTEQPGVVNDVSLDKEASMKPDQVMDISIGQVGISTSAALQMGKPVKNAVAQEIPFSNPSMQRVVHTPVFKSPSKQRVVFSPVFTKPTGRRVLQTPVVIKPTVIPCNSEVPVFLSPSQQPVTNSPVQSGTVLQPPMCDFDQLFANAPLPPGIDPRDLSPDTISLMLELMNFKPTGQPGVVNDVSLDKEASMKPDQGLDISIGQVGISTSAALQMGKPVKNAVAQEIPFSNPSMQRVVQIKPPVNTTDVDAPVFKSPSKQRVVFSPVFTKPTGRPGLVKGASSLALYERVSVKPDKGMDISVRQNGVSTSEALKKGKPVKNVDALEIPGFSNPSMQQIVPTSVVIKRPVNTTDLEAPVFKSPSKQPVLFSPVPPLQLPVSHDNEKMPMCPSRQPVVFSPVIKPHAKTSDFEVPVLTSPSKQPVLFSPLPPLRLPIEKEKMPMCPSRQPVLLSPNLEDPVFTSPLKQPVLFSPVPTLRQPISPEQSGALMSASAESPGYASPTRPKSKMLGKIGAGLLTRSKATSKATSKSRKSVASEKSAKKTVPQEVQVTETVSKKLKVGKNDTEKNGGKGKAGLIRRCVDSIKRRTESALSNHKVIKVKPATPDCAVQNVIKRSARTKTVAKKVIPQPNMRPDKGIVWPLEFEGLSCHNKAYYVEQFHRSELFKQRCKKKQKGGNSWINGLTAFQLWVVEHEGSDAIDAILNPLPKTKNDAKAKVKCWRGETPDLFLV